MKLWIKYLLLFLCLISLLLLVNASISYYIVEDSSPFFLGSPNDFYFQSDMLEPDSKSAEYTISNYQAGEELLFFLSNYDDELRISKEQIQFELLSYIIASDGSSTLVDDIIVTKDALIEAEKYLLNEGHNKSLFALVIPEKYFQNQEVQVEIKAQSIQPFTTSLSATFTIFQPFTNTFITLNSNAGAPTASLRISTYEFSGQLTLQYPNTIFPDRTSPYLATIGGGSEKDIVVGEGLERSQMTVQVNSFSSYTITLFKDIISDNISSEDFLILEDRSNT